MKKISTALGRNLPISTKHSVEICNLIKGKKVERAKTILEGVIAVKVPVPFKRYNKDVAHKVGIAGGRFPAKASTYILQVLKNAEANASANGLVTPFVISEARATQGARAYKMSRMRGRKSKRTHVYFTIKEEAKKTKEKKVDKGQKTETAKKTDEANT